MIKKFFSGKEKTIIITLVSLLLLVAIFLIDLKNNKIAAYGDTFFHAQRIYELRMAFKEGVIPGFLNFNTFHHLGQAINGMYPDYTLWPFVFFTNKLSIVKQIITIKLLIILCTYIVTVCSVSKRYGYELGFLISNIYVLSGMVFRNYVFEMQLGTALVLVVAFPLFFNFKELLESGSKENMVNIILIGIFILYSHLTSFVVFFILLIIDYIFQCIYKKKIFYLKKMIITGVMIVLGTIPIIYRYVYFTNIGMRSPYSEGKVYAMPVIDLFTKSIWDARETLSIVSIICIIFVFHKLNFKNIKTINQFLIFFVVLCIFGTNLAPWELLQKLPIFKNFQNAGWRFLIYTDALPLLMLIGLFNKKTSIKLLQYIGIVSLVASLSSFSSYRNQFNENYEYSDKINRKNIDYEKNLIMEDKDINSDRLLRTILPDYAPKNTKIDESTNGAHMSKKTVDFIMSGTINVDGKNIPMKIVSNTYGNKYILTRSSSGDIRVPIYIYKKLNYSIKVNNKLLTNFKTVDGMLEFRDRGVKIIDVSYKYSPSYIILMICSFSIILLMISLKIIIIIRDSKLAHV